MAMTDRKLNWFKFGGLVGLAFILGVFFAGLLDLPSNTMAQGQGGVPVSQAQSAQPAVRAIPGTQPLTQLSDAFAAVAETVRPSVVFITSQRTRTLTQRNLPPGFEQYFNQRPGGPQIERGQGSGFVVSRDGYILTNTHVVEDADRVTVELLDHRRFNAKVVGADPLTDIAVVKIDADGLTPASLGSSDAVRIGEWVLAVGNPLGQNLTFTVTSGIVSAKGRGRLGLPNSGGTAIQDFIQTDAAINPGNSGGPLVNVRGEVIGINSAIASQTGTYVGYGFAIPIDLVKNVMAQLIETGNVQRAALGVFVNDADGEDASYVGLDEIRGVRIDGFPSTTSPARRAGLDSGDVIIAIDGRQVDYTAQLQQLVGFRKPGETVKVEVARRGGARRTYDVRLIAQDQTPEVARAEDARSEPSGADPSGTLVEDLGVRVEQLTTESVRQFGLGSGIQGLLVREVSPNGPAISKLFDVGSGSPDIITGVEGEPVRTVAELRAAIRGGGYGGIVTLMVYNPASNANQGGQRVERIRVR